MVPDVEMSTVDVPNGVMEIPDGVQTSGACNIAGAVEAVNTGKVPEVDLPNGKVNVKTGVERGKATRLAQYGDDFGKMGTYVENPNIKIDWSQYAEHGFERMQQRGMTQEMVDQIVANGKVLSQNNGSKFVFITQKVSA